MIRFSLEAFMQKSCNLLGWGLAIIAVLLLVSHMQLGFLALLLFVSFIFACAVTRSDGHTSRLSSEAEKR